MAGKLRHRLSCIVALVLALIRVGINRRIFAVGRCGALRRGIGRGIKCRALLRVLSRLRIGRSIRLLPCGGSLIARRIRVGGRRLRGAVSSRGRGLRGIAPHRCGEICCLRRGIASLRILRSGGLCAAVGARVLRHRILPRIALNILCGALHHHYRLLGLLTSAVGFSYTLFKSFKRVLQVVYLFIPSLKLRHPFVGFACFLRERIATLIALLREP